MTPATMKSVLVSLLVIGLVVVFAASVSAKSVRTPSPSPSPLPSPTLIATAEPTPMPRPDLTQTKGDSSGELEQLILNHQLGPIFPTNVLKYAIRASVEAGIPANTIVLLLLLPLSGTVIAALRQIIGVRGFGIFLPAALSVVFVATGPVVGIAIFLLIVFVSTAYRFILRKSHLRLLYLPRMALQLWAVVLGVLAILFLAPVISIPELGSVSIFPILFLALLAEDFSKVQLGKSAKTAISLTSETLFLAFVSYIFLTHLTIQTFALKYPEILLIVVALVDILLGRFVGLRVLEIWRFKQLIRRRS